MTAPNDLALLRAYWSGDEVDPSQLPRQVWPDIRSLADEVERLRAENAQLTGERDEWRDNYDTRATLFSLALGQLDAMRPVVEAARAWFKVVTREIRGEVLLREEHMDVARALRHAVAAYEQEKSGSQPSPQEDASGRGIAPSTAAGDLSPQESVEYRAFLRKMSADRIEESHMADGDLSQVNKDVLADARRLDALADRMEKK